MKKIILFVLGIVLSGLVLAVAGNILPDPKFDEDSVSHTEFNKILVVLDGLYNDSGNFGIGIEPTVALDVNGVLRLEPEAKGVCSEPGKLVFDDSSKHLYGCNGGTWSQLDNESVLPECAVDDDCDDGDSCTTDVCDVTECKYTSNPPVEGNWSEYTWTCAAGDPSLARYGTRTCDNPVPSCGGTCLGFATTTEPCGEGGICENGACVGDTSCTATTVGTCDLAATQSGSTSGTCVAGYVGSCSSLCTDTMWGTVANDCVEFNATTDCEESTFDNCYRAARPDGETSGTCVAGYPGTCFYTCNNTAWGNPSENLCGCAVNSDCNDGESCTTDTCDTGTGECSNINTPVPGEWSEYGAWECNTGGGPNVAWLNMLKTQLIGYTGTYDRGRERTCTNPAPSCGGADCVGSAWEEEYCPPGEVCIMATGECETNCTETCTSLSYDCGSPTICGATEDCGTCDPGWTCTDFVCQEDEEIPCNGNVDCGLVPLADCTDFIDCSVEPLVTGGDCGGNIICASYPAVYCPTAAPAGCTVETNITTSCEGYVNCTSYAGTNCPSGCDNVVVADSCTGGNSHDCSEFQQTATSGCVGTFPATCEDVEWSPGKFNCGGTFDCDMANCNLTNTCTLVTGSDTCEDPPLETCAGSPPCAVGCVANIVPDSCNENNAVENSCQDFEQGILGCVDAPVGCYNVPMGPPDKYTCEGTYSCANNMNMCSSLSECTFAAGSDTCENPLSNCNTYSGSNCPSGCIVTGVPASCNGGGPHSCGDVEFWGGISVGCKPNAPEGCYTQGGYQGFPEKLDCVGYFSCTLDNCNLASACTSVGDSTICENPTGVVPCEDDCTLTGCQQVQTNVDYCAGTPSCAGFNENLCAYITDCSYTATTTDSCVGSSSCSQFYNNYNNCNLYSGYGCSWGE